MDDAISRMVYALKISDVPDVMMNGKHEHRAEIGALFSVSQCLRVKSVCSGLHWNQIRS